MSKLRERMINEMKLRRFSPKTQEAYVDAVSGLARYYDRSPDRIDNVKIKRYLLHLMESRKLAWSSCNVAVCGLRFFYNKTLGRQSTRLAIPPRKQQHKLPEILSSQELERLFLCANTPKNRVLFMTVYSAGLRLGEVVQLKISHIDSSRMMIRVEQGKGNKDRYTLLSKVLLKELRSYWKLYRPKLWLFPGARNPNEPMPDGTVQKAFTLTKAKAGIKKGKGIHTLRHCFATHLLEAGIDLRTIQMLMGHNSITTTMIYLQVTRKRLNTINSSLDLLDLSQNENIKNRM